MPVGPFGLQDLAGIDVGARIRAVPRLDRQDPRRGPAVRGARQALRIGRYGQKTGAGWYRYEAGSRQRLPDPLVDQLAAEAGCTPRHHTPQHHR